MMVFRKVVFPAPLGPTSPIFSPLLNAYENPSMIRFSPNDRLASSNSTMTSPMRVDLDSTRSTVLVRDPYSRRDR